MHFGVNCALACSGKPFRRPFLKGNFNVSWLKDEQKEAAVRLLPSYRVSGKSGTSALRNGKRNANVRMLKQIEQGRVVRNPITLTQG